MPKCADPEREAQRRARFAEATRKQWADPAIRERRRAAIKAKRSTPESRSKSAHASRAQWEDPEIRAKHVEALTAAHAEGRMGNYDWLKGLRGEQTSQWTRDDVGYRAMHTRIANALGRADEHDCIDCGRRANEWSFIDRRGHSPRIEDYEPRCYSCHRRYDRQHMGVA